MKKNTVTNITSGTSNPISYTTGTGTIYTTTTGTTISSNAILAHPQINIQGDAIIYI